MSTYGFQNLTAPNVLYFWSQGLHCVFCGVVTLVPYTVQQSYWISVYLSLPISHRQTPNSNSQKHRVFLLCIIISKSFHLWAAVSWNLLQCPQNQMTECIMLSVCHKQNTCKNTFNHWNVWHNELWKRILQFVYCWGKNQIISPSQFSFFVMHFLVFAILTGSGLTGALLLVFICSVLCSSICNLAMFR